ncbi:MAG TPA: lysyl oxidase family protein, partial [Acidimicrobiales bacterium]|nr:lysyl oxidase family protein [Acidimicrobiales bacterium]
PVASTPLGFPIPNPVPLPTSCYLDETVPVGNPTVSGLQQPTLRCLRFTSDVRNVGGGALEIRIPLLNADSSGITSSYLPGECLAQQVLTSSIDTQVTRSAGACLFHTQHLHFHYSDLLGYTLYNVTATGSIGPKVATSVKASFCLSDDDYFGFGTSAPNSQRDFTGQPGCNVPASGTSIDEGIKPGWGDVYTWDTPGQYIDVTNLASGTYDLVEETNPTGALIVAGPAQTCALTKLLLTSSSVSIVSQSASIPCPAS